MKQLFKSISYALLLILFFVHSAQADTIYSDDFEDGNVNGWSVSGVVDTASLQAIGSYAMRLRGIANASRNISTLGYSNVSIEMNLAATSLESPDDCFAEVSVNGGGVWSIVVEVNNGQDNGTFYSNTLMPAGADDNANLVVRFRATGATTGDYCYGDNVIIAGTLGGITPNPEIDAATTISFGNVETGSVGNQTLTVSNIGTADLQIGSIVGLAAPFSVVIDACSNQTIIPAASCIISLSFSPASEIFYSDTLSIPSNDTDENPLNITVSGTGASPGGGTVQNFDPLSGDGSVVRSQLGFNTLINGSDPGLMVDMSAYALPANAAQPGNYFSGQLQLQGEATGGDFNEQRDDFLYTNNRDSTRKHLPEFDFEFIQTGTHIFPLQRGSIASAHPEWEYVFSPGRVWQENGDNGYSRVALPFALQQKNANCIHNGMMTFLFKEDGSASKVSYQISSETCLYFKVDMWGLLNATYTPTVIVDTETLTAEYQAEVNNRLPRKSFSELAIDYPGTNLNAFAAPGTTDPNHITLYGFVIDGINYVGGCETRNGTYPFCEVLVVPSYSGAKSAFGAVALMRLEHKYPGVQSEVVSNYISDCAADGNWNDVTFGNTVDMATGNYASASYMWDEGRSHTNDLFLPEDHGSKILYSCTQYSRIAAPGTTWVYHTSDYYILGTAMNAYLKGIEGSGKDIFATTIVEELWKPLKLSKTAQFSRRTYDSISQPFTGWGLMWLADDVAKITNFLNVDNGSIGGLAVLDPALLSASMQKDPSDRGIDVPLTDPFKYNNGFWAHEIKADVNCANDTWVPFMSGYGGITVLMLPNNTTYYNFSDNDTFFWVDAAIESNGIRSICQ